MSNYMENRIENIEKIDPEIASAIKEEFERQQTCLELIASENIVSKAVLEAQGSVLTNKYAEGYPSKRYYGGCSFVDVAEALAIKRAKELFDADYANVQPHSGSQANMGVYFALLEKGDTILGMDLSHGGHLTHGSNVNFSGRFFNFVHYGVGRETGTIDYEQVATLAKKHKPKMIVAGASAYPRIIDFKVFSEIAKSVGAFFVVDMAHIAGLVAAGVHPSPVPYADVVTSTTHKTLRGARGGLILAKEEHSKKINSQIFPGIQGGPLMHIIAAKAVAFKEAQSDEFKNYQKQVVRNAKVFADTLMKRGVKLISDGTDTHLMLADLTNFNVTGKEAQDILEKAGITLNRNSIPFETKSPFVTSGIRIGSQALTSRGMDDKEMTLIANFIVDILKDINNEELIKKVHNEVLGLCKKFPIYEGLR